MQESTSSNSAALDLLSMARDRLNKVRGTLCLGIFGENVNLFNLLGESESGLGCSALEMCCVFSLGGKLLNEGKNNGMMMPSKDRKKSTVNGSCHNQPVIRKSDEFSVGDDEVAFLPFERCVS